MSMAASTRKENPRAAWSSWGELTPRSKSTPESGTRRDVVQRREGGVHQGHPVRERGQLRPPRRGPPDPGRGRRYAGRRWAARERRAGLPRRRWRRRRRRRAPAQRGRRLRREYRNVCERVGHLQLLDWLAGTTGRDPFDPRWKRVEWSSAAPVEELHMVQRPAPIAWRDVGRFELRSLSGATSCPMVLVVSSSSSPAASSPRAGPAPPRQGGFHSSTRSMAPCTSTSLSSSAKARR